MAQRGNSKEETECEYRLNGRRQIARLISIRGIVQGVGFRPHTASTASRYNIAGWVQNAKKGVVIFAESCSDNIDQFIDNLLNEPPRMAFITDVEIQNIEPRGFEDFNIKQSDDSGQRELLISPDVSTCDECMREVFDSDDRHYKYPFTNCTNCGPRFTIIKSLPYDRPKTAMDEFPMCSDCEAEYTDVRDRRFHAQPVACPNCGPQVSLYGADGEPIAQSDEVWGHFARLIRNGRLVAVKGLGGYHIACSATDEKAVKRLRENKNRPRKAFALMVKNISEAKKICHINEQAEHILQSPAAPIVICDRRAEEMLISDQVAPDLNSLGIMLPYTPLHRLLLTEINDVLVMTSANLRGLPLVTDSDEAEDKLSLVVDAFLHHDRPIIRRCDDSVVRSVTGVDDSTGHIIYRRSRGYAPRPIILKDEIFDQDSPDVLGVGGDKKNTFCLLSGDQAFLSQHMGDMTYEETSDDYRKCLDDIADILEIVPRVVACDMHPNYRTTDLANEYAKQRDIPLITVQHHHAHHASCLAENNHYANALGLVADGTGYGNDETIWGMEVLYGDMRDYQRLVSLSEVPMPGGERAVRRPLRMALSHLRTFLDDSWTDQLITMFPEHKEDLTVAAHQMDRGINSPMTSSCGRLFDAVSAFVGLCLCSSYSGQPAVQLSEVVGDIDKSRSFPFQIKSDGKIYRWDPSVMWEGIIDCYASGVQLKQIASAFHRTVAKMLLEGAQFGREITGCNVIALSGGVFQNPTLYSYLHETLVEEGFSVLTHGEVPPNDGGISLGQAVVGLNSLVGKEN